MVEDHFSTKKEEAVVQVAETTTPEAEAQEDEVDNILRKSQEEVKTIEEPVIPE